MKVIEIIAKKRDGREMSPAEIEYLVKAISAGLIPDYQISAWAMAVYLQGMSEAETTALALAMAYSGEVLDLSAIQGIKVDKHSTGGVGDKTTLVVIPLVAAAGIPAAKMSGRGLGHTGGTIDKFASIPGLQVELSREEFIAQVDKVRAAVISQSGNLVPADKKLYAIRDVTATIESIPLIAASIMSKKIAAGAQGIVLDVKLGQGAFMKKLEQAQQLAETMVTIGRGAGRQVVALITDMSQPLGYCVGNALEVREAIDLLQGRGDQELEGLCIELAAQMLILGGKFDQIEAARKELRALLSSGAALAKFAELVQAQGGKLQLDVPGYGLPQASIKEEVIAEQEGYIIALDAMQVGHGAMLLGAGREKIEDQIDPAAGIELLKKCGDYVRPGEPWAIMHANRRETLPAVRKLLLEAVQLGAACVNRPPLIYQTIA